MKIKFIGTSSGKTSLKRFHSSFIIQKDVDTTLVDAGEGVSRALLSSGTDYNSISGIIFTHMHSDHSAGLPSLLTQMKMNKREEKLVIYCHSDHYSSLKSLLRITHVYPEKLEFPVNFRTFLPGEELMTGSGIIFKSASNSHLDHLISSPENVSCSLFFELAGKKVFYTGDVGNEEDLYLFNNERPDIFISEITHVSFDQVLKAFEKSGAGQLYITHIPDVEIEKEGDERATWVYDNYEIDI